MRRSFWKAAGISLAAYTAAVVLGFLVDFRVTGFAVLALFGTWTLFSVARTIQLRIRGAHRADAPPDESESYGFALGGAAFSLAALLAIVVLSQVV